MKTKIDVYAVVTPKKIDNFMHCLDLFSNNKRVCELHKFSFNVEATNPPFEKICFMFKEMLNKNEEINLCAVFIPGVKEGAWADKSIKVASNGKKWCLFEDYLKRLNFAGDLE